MSLFGEAALLPSYCDNCQASNMLIRVIINSLCVPSLLFLREGGGRERGREGEKGAKETKRKREEEG